MQPESKPLNVRFPPSSFTWRAQGFVIVGSVLLSLLAVGPDSLTAALLAIVLGTPFIWLLFGAGLVQRVQYRFLQFLIYAVGYLLISLALKASIKHLMVMIVSHGLA